MKRPKSTKYRNLYQPKGRTSIWYSRDVRGRRFGPANTHASPDTLEGWQAAATWRDKYEAQQGIDRVRVDHGAMPTFSELVPKYFESQKFGQLAATSQQDRRLHLAEGGPVMQALGARPVDEINADALVEWWETHARAREWSTATGSRYLSTIAEVLKCGRKHIAGRALPTIEARERIFEAKATAAGRAQDGAERRPIRDPDVIDALVESARERGTEALAFVLTLLDGGLRKGEGRALRWRCVAWGADADDPRRHLLVRGSRSRGADEDGHTKSGRTRKVALSRRLRAVLIALFEEQRPATLDALVFPGMDETALRALWPALLTVAGAPGVMMKDLRDSFGSWLLTLGIPIQYVSRQLGHSSIAVTEKHYAEYLGRDGDSSQYVEPPKLEPGEVPADLLARLAITRTITRTDDPYALPASLADSLKSLELN